MRCQDVSGRFDVLDDAQDRRAGDFGEQFPCEARVVRARVDGHVYFCALRFHVDAFAAVRALEGPMRVLPATFPLQPPGREHEGVLGVFRSAVQSVVVQHKCVLSLVLDPLENQEQFPRKGCW